jgi:transposase-like protein
VSKAIEVITSVERRRRWSAAEKERLVAASLEPSASVSGVAREAGIHASQLYRDLFGARNERKARLIDQMELRNLTVSTAGKSAQERSEWDDRFMRRVWLRLSSSSRAGADRVFGYCDR